MPKPKPELDESSEPAVSPSETQQSADVEPAESLRKVRVPAEVGDSVTLSGGGQETRTFNVVDGVISPSSKADAAELVALLPGAEYVD